MSQLHTWFEPVAISYVQDRDGRTILVLAAAAVGASALAGMLSWGSLAPGLVFVVVGSVQWVRSMPRNDVAHA